MAIERFYNQIDAIGFLENGQTNGVVKVSNTAFFKVKMIVVLKADGFEDARFEVKRVLDKNYIILGPEGKPIHTRSDLSAYTLSLNPTIEAPFQERPKIPPADFERATYEEEPTSAKRSFLVDRYGNAYGEENPFPIKQSGGSFLNDVAFDTITANYPDELTEIYFYKTGGVSGSTVATVTVKFTSSDKEYLDFVSKEIVVGD